MQQVDNEIMVREAQRVEYHNDQARLLTLPATLTLEQWMNTLNHFQWTCAYCSDPYEVLEHFISLALQGETSASNCLPSCTACNARKQERHPGSLSWIAPSALLYIRSYFASLHTGREIAPRVVNTATIEERPDAIYTIKDVTSRFQLSEKTVRRLIESGELQGVRIHGSWKFAESDIQRFIDQNRRPRRTGRMP